MKNLEVGLKGNSLHVIGLRDGSKEYEKELNMNLVRLHQKSKDKTRGKDLGLGL